ncbi:Putative Zinc finger, FYVE/PHD-type [Septoria linicola]|uniref:Zinc finger, FYVE/PHD-type n=1 Tax=Septoria linicola TaxID=215465 RepID=A0A9Q9EKE2_9PEZI|nr:putative Zinc finger, FYVE/PHD-type [Septoria linicola]USW53970.1 Putative Zinc finger, FYVE/PHD-type [Septoria linicola]
MVRMLDLEEDADSDSHPPLRYQHAIVSAVALNGSERHNPNVNSFTAALSCYPVVASLASYIDLTTLSDLAQTCRQIRANLLQYRVMLIQKTLRCQNELTDLGTRLGDAFMVSRDAWSTYGRHGVKVDRITSGRVGACARDMVSECRSCGEAICRNCVIKAPPSSAVKLRHRRLCRTCLKAPLTELTSTTCAFDEAGNHVSNQSVAAYEYRKYARDPCNCSDVVWLCSPCGHAMRTQDTTYDRGWKWRGRYSHCGGIGAGLGEGNEGVECGRTENCLAARMVQKDVECDADELAALELETAKAGSQGRHWNGSSYSTQEMVGIGGRVKTKVRKMVPVGAIVKEYEDERISEHFLEREQTGTNRSWCSWCSRVVVGKKDLDSATRSVESVASSSPAGSA